MPFLMPPASGGGGDTYIISPAIIGEGPPQGIAPADSGRFYIDKLTDLAWVNVEGVWKEVAQQGAQGAPGQPQWWGPGVPPETVPAAENGGPTPGDIYLDIATGDLYLMNPPDGSTAPSTYGHGW